MDTRLKMGFAGFVVLTLIYRLIFNDSIASNYEVPPGYSAPQSIAQIEAEEQKAFETALAQATTAQVQVAESSNEIAAKSLPMKQLKKIKKLTKLMGRKKSIKIINYKIAQPKLPTKRKVSGL